MNRIIKTILLLCLSLSLMLLYGCGSEPEAEQSETHPAQESSAQSEDSAPADPPQSTSETGDTPQSSQEESQASPPQSEAQTPPPPIAEPLEVTFTDTADGVAVTFSRLPTSAADLEALPVEYFQTPEYAAAMYVALICHYEENPNVTFEMWEFLNGPEEVSSNDMQFTRDRLEGKIYKVLSFFKGATPENDYTPSEPLTTVVMENPYTYDDEGYARFLMQSGGADSERFITVRQKPSTGEWFYWDNALLADIRVPSSQDEWS